MISLLTPTYRRASRLKEMVESARATAAGEFEIVAAADDDDFETLSALKEMNIKVNSGPLLTKKAPWNRASEISSGDILMMCADDVIFKTSGWDLIIEEAFSASTDKILMAYGDDGHHGEKFSAFPIISRKWMEITGYFTHPAFPGEMTDLWLFDVAGMLGRRRYLPFLAEHMHWLWGKAEKDHTYQIAEDIRKREHPSILYRQLWRERQEDAAKLRKVMAC